MLNDGLDWSGVDYCNVSDVSKQVMQCYISPNLFCSANAHFCMYYSFKLFLWCFKLVVDEEIPPYYVKRFECLEKRYINVTNYYYY